MARQLIKGNEAVVKAALLAGCRSYFGYPITPASEIAQAAAYYFPLAGGTFVQAESEVASINMVYGAAGSGVRTMTASSGPGISLKQEGISYCAGAELPVVVIDVMRGGPGLGNIGPEQGDYHQIVKGGGHGNYHTLVLAPNCAQEMCDLTMLAFELADKWRNPVVVLTDGFIGQMMEPVEFPPAVERLPDKPWSVQGNAKTRPNLITSIYLSHEELEEHNLKLQKKYEQMREAEQRHEEFLVDDADMVLVGYGIISRVLRSVVLEARKMGMKVGMLRPITLWPLPARRLKELASSVSSFFVVELSNGQMVDDVRLETECRVPVRFYGRMGGQVPTVQEVLEQVATTQEVELS